MCLFCKIIAQEFSSYKIYENDYVYSFLDINPNDNGHCLIVPKKHFDSLSTTDELYLVEMAKSRKIITQILQEKLQPSGFNFLSNEGNSAGQVIFHYHEHIIPKYQKGQGFSFKIDEYDLDSIETTYKKITQ